MKPLSRACFALVLLLVAPIASAWSTLGHRLVGELAERHLSPAAQAEVKTLLAGESDPTLAGVAYWADALRNDNPDEFKRTSRWHYVNYPKGQCDYVPARDCPDGNCVIGAIEAQRAILADKSQPREKRRDALKFLVHLVGDVHQPMHAGNHDDLGGNKFQISLRTDIEPEKYARDQYVGGVMGTNLHSVWDYYILAEHRLGLMQYADELDRLPWPPKTDTTTSAPQAWAGESCRLIDARHLYPEAHKMDSSYLDAMRPLAEQRVRQAAYRLATVLNSALSE